MGVLRPVIVAALPGTMSSEPLITTSLNVDVPLAAVMLPRTPPVAVIAPVTASVELSVVAPVTPRVPLTLALPCAVSALPDGIVKPTVENCAMLAPRIDIHTEPAPERYRPLLVSLRYERPGPVTVPSAMRNGASMPPAPVRDSELVISLARSSIVSLAHVVSIVVPGTTGLPAGSV